MDGKNEFSSSSPPKPDLNEIFSRKVLNAQDLLIIPDIVSEVKLNSDTFSTSLKARPELVKQFIDYALRPEMVQNQKGNFPVTYPFMSMEILCFQTQQFVDFLLNTKQTVSQNPPEENKQTKNGDSSAQRTLLSYMFELLRTDSRINETAAGYLVKLLNQIQYQRGNELFHFFETNTEIFDRILFHCYSKCISDIFSKLLSIDSEDLPPKKLIILGKIILSLHKQTRDVELAEKLDNISNIFLDLLEKCPERYEGSRYISLLSQVISEVNCAQLTSLLLAKSQNDDILIAGLDVLDRFLSFYKAEKAKKDRKNLNAQNSAGSSMIAEEIQEPNIINSEALLIIEKLTNTILNSFENYTPSLNSTKDIYKQPQLKQDVKEHESVVPQESIQTQNGLNLSGKKELQQEKVLVEIPKQKFKLSQLKLFVLVQDLITLEPKGSVFEQDLLTVAFIRYVIRMIKQHPNNNLMHNIIKNILIKGVKGKSSTAQTICSNDVGLIEFILESSKNKVELSYKNQLYHITTAIEQTRLKDPQLTEIIAKNYPSWKEFIDGPYIERRKTYNRLLGDQDPKKKSDICMFSFPSRPAKANSGIRVEVEQVKPYNFNDKGQLGDDNEIDEDLALDIESDDDKPVRPSQSHSNSKRGIGALESLMTKEVKSEDDDTVRIDDDLLPNIPIKMQIEEQPGLEIEPIKIEPTKVEADISPQKADKTQDDEMKEQIPRPEEESLDKRSNQ